MGMWTSAAAVWVRSGAVSDWMLWCAVVCCGVVVLLYYGVCAVLWCSTWGTASRRITSCTSTRTAIATMRCLRWRPLRARLSAQLRLTASTGECRLDMVSSLMRATVHLPCSLPCPSPVSSPMPCCVRPMMTCADALCAARVCVCAVCVCACVCA